MGRGGCGEAERMRARSAGLFLGICFRIVYLTVLVAATVHFEVWKSLSK